MILSEFGHVDSVDFDTLGDTLSADAVATATTLHVKDTADFDEDGGHILVDGSIPLEYSTCDGDPESADPTITLIDPLPAAASEGARVDLWDPTRAEVVTEMIAVVHIDGDDDGELVECVVEQHLLDQLPVGTRDNAGESVRLEVEDGEWRVVDVLGGAAPILAGQSSAVKFHNTDTHTVEATGDQAISLSAEPIPGSEHVYWGPLLQPPSEWSRTGKLLSVVDPGVEVDDVFSVAYAHLGPVVTPAAPAGPGTYFDELMALGPLVYLRLNETSGFTAADSSGNNRDATYVGGPALNQASLLTDGDASATFSGDDRVNLADAAWMDVSALTIVAWVKSANFATTAPVAKRDGGSGSNRVFLFDLDPDGANNRMRFIRWTSAGSGQTVNGATSVANGESRMVAVTHDGSTIKLYLDAVDDGSAADASGLNTSATAALFLAGDDFRAVGPFDEFAMFNYALSAAELATLFAAGTA